jgi:hypothetical protein
MPAVLPIRMGIVVSQRQGRPRTLQRPHR